MGLTQMHAPVKEKTTKFLGESAIDGCGARRKMAPDEGHLFAAHTTQSSPTPLGRHNYYSQMDFD